MPIGELFLSALIQVLFDRLASRELLQFALQEGIHSKLKKWEKTLKMIQAVLDDAEEKQLKNRAVKIWLDDLRDLAYDVEDILDEFSTDALAKTVTLEQNQQASTSKARNLLPACFNNWSPRAIKFNIRMGSEIKNVTSRLKELCKLRDDLGLKEITGGTSSNAVSQRTPTTSVPTEPAVHGRDEDKAKILEMVLKNEPSDANFCVIPIVGMGGVGKTTLARQVYNDMAVDFFEVKAWVCISDDFDVLRISKAILESITGSSSDLKELETVQTKLKEKVAGRKFLLVLDDVWSEDYSKWEKLKSPFMAGARCSRIIVTTRIREVALKMRPSGFYQLNVLPDEDCWSVFRMHAFENGNIPTDRNIELIRQKVVEKSKGLPLAAKTLGGVLRSKQTEDEWLKILNSEIWELLEVGGNEIPTALKLSYHHLPSHLKRCFAYCAIFPKDYEFQEEELVLLWMAEGLLQQSTDRKQPEDFGAEYVNDLFSRSLFQQSNSNSSTFVMHDLVHDLAQWAFGEISLRLDNEMGANKKPRELEKVRHFSYTVDEFDGKNKFEVFCEAVSLKARIRTFMAISEDVFCWNYITNMIVFDMLPKLKTLRALSLRTYHIVELPNSIGGLKHLRYLNLAYTEIRSLPESTSSLYNLQILLLTGCYYLKKLPSNFRNLINLRHLDIRGASSIEEMPVGLKELKSLQKLSNFILGKNSGSTLKDLKSLEFLHGELCISRLHNVIDCDLGDLVLRDKMDLKELSLEWEVIVGHSHSENVLDMLQPHQNLQKLTIKCYGGTRFPHWVGSFSKMTVLKLERCVNCTSLPSFGLLSSLKDLTIRGMRKLKILFSEIYGVGCSKPFQSLETLYLEDLKELEHWETINENEHVGTFPCLRELSIRRCPKLSGRLPNRLPSLEKLEIKNCEQLVVSFSSLPMLCELTIDGCKGITRNSPTDFKSLKSMTLEDISDFGNWFRQENFQKVEFLKLKITGCEQLMNLWKLNETFLEKPLQGLQSFISMTELLIENCSNLVSFPEVCFLSNLSKLEIRNCNALTSLPKGIVCNSLTGQLPSYLKRLKIESCEKLEYLWYDNEESCTSVVDEENSNNTTRSLLEYLKVEECPSLNCLSSSGLLPETLQHLYVEDCNSLTFIVRGKLPSSLKKLEIVGCEKLEYLWDDNEESCTSVVDEENSNNTTRSLLEYLDVRKCISLNCLSSSGLLPETLQYLCVGDCNSLTFIVRGKLPSSLKKLEIKGCEKLEYLWDDKEESCTSVVDEENNNNTSTSHLEYLHVVNCLSLKCLSSSGHLPKELRTLSLNYLPELESIAKTFLNSRSLEEISVWSCKNLKSIPKGLHNLIHLRKIEIFGCESIDCLGEEGPPNTNLSELAILDCEKLKALPNWFHSLNSLKSLTLKGCPMYKAVLEWGLHNLTSLTSLDIRGLPEAESFPQQELKMTFPPSLTHLIIYSFPNLKCLMGEGFRNLKSLEYLSIIHYPNLTSFPEIALPSSIQSLSIHYCQNLKSISKLGLPSSLSELRIRSCKKLRSFPEQGLPSSLSKLDITYCGELRSFPKQGLPSSLLELHIGGCPKLKEECKRDKGKEWSKISHIPYVRIDFKYTYDPCVFRMNEVYRIPKHD